MSEEQKRQLQQQLWNIANTLRGKMDADEFRDYILGFIFYKYLSEKFILPQIKFYSIQERTSIILMLMKILNQEKKLLMPFMKKSLKI